MRQDWDTYFLQIAEQVATRATCSRRQAGAVIVQNNRIKATGYNGGPSGYGHCIDGHCPRGKSKENDKNKEYEDCIAIHAEMNALLEVAPEHCLNGIIYCTHSPCFMCAKLICNSGIRRVVYREVLDGTWSKTYDFMNECGLSIGCIPS